MNKKGFLDLDFDFGEMNYTAILLSVAGGFIAYFAASRVPDVSFFIPVMSAIFTMIICYVMVSFMANN